MNSMYPQPVIIGTDLAGLLISIALSNARIEHTLIGGAPTEQSLHHGETTNMVAPVIFLQNFSELMHCVYEKKFGIVHAGKHTIKLDFSDLSLLPMKLGLKIFEGIDFTYPLQIDRVALDQALFEKAAYAPYCTHLDSTVSEIDYKRDVDTIRQVQLADGTELTPSHVFDASGQECVVGKQIGLATRQVDEPYFLIQVYYQTDKPLLSPNGQTSWCDELNILRLYQKDWGIDGLVTLIPLGDRLSVRLSLPLRQLQGERTENGALLEPKPTVEELLTIAERAVYQLGIPYRELFPQQMQLHSAVNEQYVHERAYGANWLLTGMAYCNTLVTTAISADTAFEALHVGPGFLKRPAEMGAYYKQYMDYYLKMQEMWQQLATHDPAIVTIPWARRMAETYIGANGLQHHQSLLLQQFDNPLRFGTELAKKVIEAIPPAALTSPFCTITKRGSILE